MSEIPQQARIIRQIIYISQEYLGVLEWILVEHHKSLIRKLSCEY